MSDGRAFGILAIVVATTATAVVGSVFEPGDWYRTLQKPAYTPPDLVFPIVWTILYALMATAATLVWLSPPSPWRRPALTLYGAQLIANALWSWLFFGLHHIDGALLDLLALLALLVLCVISFWRVRPVAGILMIPYLLWAGFAAILNHHIWLLNQ